MWPPVIDKMTVEKGYEIALGAALGDDLDAPVDQQHAMEMCIDNPREGFADLFATHPSIESRVTALVQFAGGHDPGPLDLPEETQDESPQQTAPEQQEPGAPGPWSSDAPAPKPFLPAEPPVTLGGPAQSGPPPGPWGPPRQN